MYHIRRRGRATHVERGVKRDVQNVRQLITKQRLEPDAFVHDFTPLSRRPVDEAHMGDCITQCDGASLLRGRFIVGHGHARILNHCSDDTVHGAKPWQPAIRDATAGARRRAGLGTPRRRTQHHATARTSDKTETSKGSVQLTSCRAGSVRRDNRGVMFGEKVARGGISDPSLRSPDFQFWHRPSGRGSARHYSTANGGDSLGSWLPSVWGQRDSLP